MKSHTGKLIATTVGAVTVGVAFLAILVFENSGQPVAFAAPSITSAAPPKFQGRKGVNLHTWFTWVKQTSPNHFSFPTAQNMPGEVSPASAKNLRASGFDFVRLTVEPGIYMSTSDAEQGEAFETLAAGIDRLHSAHLAVIVNFQSATTYQPDLEVDRKGGDAFATGLADPTVVRFIRAIQSFAERLDKRYGARHDVAFEPINEPRVACGSSSWRQQQIAMHKAARAGAPRLTLVISGGCTSGIPGLVQIDPADYADSNLLYTIHYYDRATFTHQGIEHASRPLAGLVRYPTFRDTPEKFQSNVAMNARFLGVGIEEEAKARLSAFEFTRRNFDRSTIHADFTKAADWARGHNLRLDQIYLGEFGVNRGRAGYVGAPELDRLQWIRDVREEAEAAGFRWSIWALRTGSSKENFGIESGPGDTSLDRPTLAALGLPSPAPSPGLRP